ncbi:integrase_H2C2 domain-containing protein [Trichonephila clavipes]|nr:integrase_H2C2 domain-containing protein [Trichonephila clavipes]
MYKDTKNFVRSCTVCLSRKNAFKIPPVSHQPVEQSQEPGETCHIDIFGPLKTTPKVYRNKDIFPHRGRAADFFRGVVLPGAPNILCSVNASATSSGRHTHMIAELSSRDGTIFFAGCNIFVCYVFERGEE